MFANVLNATDNLIIKAQTTLPMFLDAPDKKAGAGKGGTDMNYDKTDWDLTTFLRRIITTLKEWGNYIIIIIGIVMVLVGGYQIAKGFISHGKAQTNWVIAILLVIVGGAFMVGGWTFMSNVAAGGQKTIEDLGQSKKEKATPTIVPGYDIYFDLE